jgi:hypothetical protein
MANIFLISRVAQASAISRPLFHLFLMMLVQREILLLRRQESQRLIQQVGAERSEIEGENMEMQPVPTPGCKMGTEGTCGE